MKAQGSSKVNSNQNITSPLSPQSVLRGSDQETRLRTLLDDAAATERDSKGRHRPQSLQRRDRQRQGFSHRSGMTRL